MERRELPYRLVGVIYHDVVDALSEGKYGSYVLRAGELKEDEEEEDSDDGDIPRRKPLPSADTIGA